MRLAATDDRPLNRLLRLMGQIQGMLRALPGMGAVGGAAPETMAERAARLYRARRRRDALFGDDLGPIGEGGWDILLDLYACGTGGGPAALSSACSAAAAPATLALRQVHALEQRGLVMRVPGRSREDPRGVRLTERATSLMERFLAAPDL